jgi:hypothetical protein
MREKDPGKLLDLLEKSGEEVSKDPKLLEEIVGALSEVASLPFSGHFVASRHPVFIARGVLILSVAGTCGACRKGVVDR